MSGHGWVTPNADGSKARCGGPALCTKCALELARQHHKDPWRNELGTTSGRVERAGKLGRAGMPKAEKNDLDSGEGSRWKQPVRYDE